jgi:hypothetical protein
MATKTDKVETTEVTTEDAQTMAQTKLDGLREQVRKVTVAIKKEEAIMTATESTDKETLNALKAEAAGLSVEVSETEKEIETLQLQFLRAEAQKRRDEFALAASQEPFDSTWISEDPELELKVVAGIAGALQYLDVGGEDWMRYLEAQVMRDSDTGGSNFATAPEIKMQNEKRRDRQRVQRERVKILREIMHQRYESLAVQFEGEPPVPELWKSDPQVRTDRAARREQRASERKEQFDEVEGKIQDYLSVMEGRIF